MRIRTPVIVFLSSLCPLCLCGESFAALDAEAKTPYELKVVLHFADHRLLTDVFCDRVERELHDGLQASFGDLVNVEVTRSHDRLSGVVHDGLASLDGWRERSAVKTHFVLIDYSGGQYVIQARQFDGLTGQPSPVVRRDQTRDPEFVAKLAALLIEQDFGMAGVFDRWPAANNDTPGEDQPVTLRLKGAGLGVPLGRWIHKGDVFAVVQMPPGDGGPGQPVVGALLQVETPPGAGAADCLCRVFWRYDPPRDGRGGFRCVKLGTVEKTPVRLRLFQALPDNRVGVLKDSLKVEIRHKGFQGEDAGTISKQTGDADDAVDTTGEKDGLFDHAAFVSVLGTDKGLKARIPIPLLDDQPVVLAINVSEDPNTSLLAFRRAAWRRDVDAAWREQAELFRDLNDKAAKPDQRALAMKLIQEGIDRSRADCKRLDKEREEIANPPPFDAGDAGERLKKIAEGADELGVFLEKIQKIDAEENDPKKKQWRTQVEEAKRLESQLEIDKALALYDQVLKEGYQPEGLKEHVEQLHKEWEPKSDAHRKARAFIFEVWPTLDDGGLKDKLAEAKAAVETCKTAGDLRTLTKFSRATDAHFVRMTQEAGKLRPDINVDDEKPFKLIQDVRDSLKPLFDDVNLYLRAYPKTPAALQVIQAQAKWRKAL